VKQDARKLSRREFLVRGSWFAFGAAVSGFPAADLLAAEVKMLDVAYAGYGVADGGSDQERRCSTG